MAMALSETDQAAEDIAAADFPKMRLPKLPARRSGLPERVPPKPSPGWIACSPATAKSFNAAAYFFGREIHRETGDVFRIECLPRGIAFQSPRASSSPSGKLVDGGLTLHPISRGSISEFRLMEETKTRRERSRLPDGPPA
jgi:hypothetical protein